MELIYQEIVESLTVLNSSEHRTSVNSSAKRAPFISNRLAVRSYLIFSTNTIVASKSHVNDASYFFTEFEKR